MANRKELKTGNKTAKRATAAAVFAITQQAYDVAFGAGQAYANAYAGAADVLQPLLAPLSGWVGAAGPTSPVTQWNHLRAAFVAGMAEARGISPDSAGKAWQRIADDMGLTKPQTTEAAAKAAQRKAKPQPEAEDDGSPKDGAGTEAAARISMELTSIEAHIVSLLRQGKRTQAAQAIADLAD
jgi:hypothetical protein